MKKRGKGIAAAFYPTGMGGGGDFSHAIVKIKPDGTADVIIRDFGTRSRGAYRDGSNGGRGIGNPI